MNEWITTALSSACVTGASIWVIQKYLLGRIRFDFDRKLEELKPLTAEAILMRGNFLNAKRDAYYEALDVVNKFLEAIPWSGPDIPEDRPQAGHVPTEAAVNSCLAKLSMFCDDPEIPEKFLGCFQTASAVSLGHFVSSLRKDLGYGDLPGDPEDYKRFFARDPSQNQPNKTPHPTASRPPL